MAIPPEEIEKEFWNNKAQETLQNKLTEDFSSATAKNIILFVGDGMDLTTLAATRAYIGGEEKVLSFEKFPSFGISNVYCLDRKVADSACSATAYLSGVKANYGTNGVSGNVPRYDCEKQIDKSQHAESIVRWAQLSGKATGFVTTTKVTHATPAGVYAHTANRYWENDFEVKNAGCDPNKVDDIAKQLIYGETGQNLNVIMGGGRKNFIDQAFIDSEGLKGIRSDGRNLLNEWENYRTFSKNRYRYVWNKSDLQRAQLNQTDYLMGLFESDHCRYNLDIKAGVDKPTLTEMVTAAIEVLKNNPNGFFLFVEGGLIDVAHHEALMQHALEETAEMARAVGKARELTSSEDTLIVVSADHGHTLTYAGYADRGNDIFGVAELSDEDLLPLPVLSYANGPGYANAYNEEGGGRADFSKQNSHDLDFQFHGTYPLNVESHGGAHVGVWADGPQSHIFTGTYDQSTIPYLMAYVGKIGPYSTGDSVKMILSKFLICFSVILTLWRSF